MDHHMMTRRRLLQVSASGLVTTTILGGALTAPTAAEAKPYASPFTWISPRGTIEVMDDYPYWVAKEMGYFGDLGVETAMEPGPSDGTAVVKFLAVEQADIGFPSPGVLSFAINNGMDLVSVFGSGFLDLFKGVDKTWGSCRAFSVCDGQPTIENCGPCDGYSVSPFGRPPHPSALSHAGICNVID